MEGRKKGKKEGRRGEKRGKGEISWALKEVSLYQDSGGGLRKDFLEPAHLCKGTIPMCKGT